MMVAGVMSDSPTLFLCFVCCLYLARYLFVDLLVGVVYERAYEGFGHIAVEVDLIPMLLVHVPRPLDALVAVAQVDGIVGLALEHYEIGALEVEASEYLAHKAEHEDGLVEGKSLVGVGLLQAIFADVFDVHFAHVLLWQM